MTDELPGAPESPSAPATQNTVDAAIASRQWSIPVPGIGSVALGSSEQLAYIGGIGALTALSIIELPLAAVLVAGHLLVNQHHNKTLTAFGEALQSKGDE
jgi:hypothetical protein